MKRILSIIMSLAITASMLAGCFGTPGDSSAASSQSAANESSSQSAAEGNPMLNPDTLIGNLLPNEPFELSDFPVEETKANLEKVRDVCMPVLSALDTPQGENYMPEDKDYAAMQENVGEMGFAVTAFPWGINNYEQVLDFCESAKACKNAAVTIYDIRNTMVFAEVFVARNGRVGKVTVYQDFPNPGIEPSEEPQSVGGIQELDRLDFTKKGYLLYHSIRMEYGDGWDGGYRVLQLSEENQRLTEKYALHFDTFNNIMIVDWDESNLDKLNMLFVFEDFYNQSGRRATDDFPHTYIESNGNEEFHFTLPAGIVEDTLTRHMPVTVEYLRSMPDYDAAQEVYNWRMPPRGGVPPFPEAVDVRKNSDGSLTITFDAIPDNQSSDRLYSSTMTVMDNPDGSIKYLSNETDYEIMYPYSHLRDLPVITVPVEEKDKADYEAGGEAYQKFCEVISPYLLTHAPDHMQYPGTAGDIESNLRFVSYLFERGLVTPDFDYKACLDTATNTYSYPRNEMAGYLRQYFPNAPDINSSNAIDYLRRHGILDWERQAYLVPAGNYSYPGFYHFGWCEDNEDGTTRITVYYSEDGVTETIRQFSFTVDLRQEPFQFLEVRP